MITTESGFVFSVGKRKFTVKFGTILTDRPANNLHKINIYETMNRNYRPKCRM